MVLNRTVVYVPRRYRVLPGADELLPAYHVSQKGNGREGMGKGKEGKGEKGKEGEGKGRGVMSPLYQTRSYFSHPI